MVMVFRVFVEFFQTLLGPNVCTVFIAEPCLFPAARQFLNQYFEHRCIALAVCVELPDMPRRPDKAGRDMARHRHLSRVPAGVRSQILSLADRDIPLVTHGEETAAPKIGMFVF